MSGHRRVKDVDYDEDDIDDYDEEDEQGTYGGGEVQEELSPEDQEQMRQGTASVREALGDTFDVSDKAIQDALWHYYYDVEKSITYLKNQQAPKQQQSKKQQQVSRFDQAAGSAAAKAKTGEFAFPSPMSEGKSAMRHGVLGPLPCPTITDTLSQQERTTERKDGSDWFKDVPWFQLPAGMETEFLPQQVRPRLKLLGGSAPPGPKPSKLAALAAARKKKENDDPASKRVGAVSLLDRLGSKPNTKPTNPTAPDNTASRPPESQRSYPLRRRISPVLPSITPPADTTPTDQPPIKVQPQVSSGPSIFAETLCGHSDTASSTYSAHDALATLYGEHGDLNGTNPFSGPSPDDVVMQAQSKGAKKQPSQPKELKAGGKLANGVSDLNLEEKAPSQKVKSKNLDIVSEYEKANRKNEASFVVIGHVDHGKSTLMGRLLYDLKIVDQRMVDKYRKDAGAIGKSSFALAWVMDSTTEERERGVTVDIATNHFETEKTKFTILDAPGHRDFIPNMIAGASQADFAVLVIDASTNSFESGLKGQTKEHALLVRSMGVQRVIVAINKMDMTAWSEDRFTEIKQQMSAFLTTAGFQDRNLAFIPCAGLTGGNIVSKAPAEAGWYGNGPTLVNALEAYESTKAVLNKPLRLSISDVFRGSITNPLSVSGRIEAGSLQVGDSVIAMPAGETASVRGIEIDNEAVDWAVAGQLATIHLSDIDAVHLRVGDIICDSGKPIRNIKSFTTKVLAFEHVLPMQVEIHRGRLHVPGVVTSMLAVLDKVSGEVVKKRPRVVQPGSVARVKIELDRPVPLEVPARVVIRAGGVTIAAGLIEEVQT